MADLNINPEEILSAGITNQRTSWVLWDKETAEPVRNMVNWQDSRAMSLVKQLEDDPEFYNKFPLISQDIKPYYTPIALHHVMQHEPYIKELVDKDKVLIGTPDTWLIYKLTGGKVHATCASNASSMGCFLNEKVKWNDELMDYLSINKNIWPEIKDEADDYGVISKEILGAEIPILGVVADQQSALFAQGCHDENTVKCTNGTGTFITVNIGNEYKEIKPPFNILIAWKFGDKVTYMVEGHSITAGTAVDWMKDKVKLFDDINELNDIVDSVEDSGGTYFVPALSGYAHPYFDFNARGSFMGLSGGTTNTHMIRSVIESIAYSATYVLDSLREHNNVGIEEIKISGGVTKSSILSQYIADLTGSKIERPVSLEASALGAVQFAAIKQGIVTPEDVKNNIEVDRYYEPRENTEKIHEDYKNWQRALERSLDWIQP